MDRIPLTFPVLSAAREVVFLVSGQSKAEALCEVLQGQPSREQRPAAFVRPVDAKVSWLVDEAAASRVAR